MIKKIHRRIYIGGAVITSVIALVLCGLYSVIVFALFVAAVVAIIVPFLTESLPQMKAAWSWVGRRLGLERDQDGGIIQKNAKFTSLNDMGTLDSDRKMSRNTRETRKQSTLFNIPENGDENVENYRGMARNSSHRGLSKNLSFANTSLASMNLHDQTNQSSGYNSGLNQSGSVMNSSTSQSRNQTRSLPKVRRHR